MTTATATPTKQKLKLSLQLERIVGQRWVSTSSEDLARHARTTLPRGTEPVAIVKPSCSLEVQRIMSLASERDVPVYPISCGKNWGYGDTCAPQNGCILIDLSRMNRILEVNEELAYAVLEPGVTQGQLANYIDENRLSLWMDATGAGPDASVVGNILERGVGLSPYSDRYGHSCAYEVVLADGRIIRTGYGSYPNAKAEHLYKDGLGPSLDGLFTQANFGIVTRMTVWLMPKPERFAVFFIRLKKKESLGPLVEVLRKLRLSGTIRCSVHCFSSLRILGGFTRFPYDQASGRRALEDESPELTQSLLDKHGITSWVVSGSVSGSRAEFAAAKKTLKRALRPLRDATINFITPGLLKTAQTVFDYLPKWKLLDGPRLQLEKVSVWVNFLQGRSSRETLVGSHWRARGETGPDQNPLDSGSGMIWVSPVLPMTAQGVKDVSEIGERIFHEHGFEYQVTFSQVSDRALCAVQSIQFDRCSPEETERAAACHDSLVQSLLARGYIPYRGTPRTVALLRDAAPGFWKATEDLKRGLDPDDLVAPGRYVQSQRPE